MKCVYCDRNAEHDIPVENAIGSYPVCNKHYLLPPGNDFQEIVLDMLVDLEHKVSMLLDKNPQTVELDPNGRYVVMLKNASLAELGAFANKLMDWMANDKPGAFVTGYDVTFMRVDIPEDIFEGVVA